MRLTRRLVRAPALALPLFGLAFGAYGQDAPPTVAVVGKASMYEDDDHTTIITYLTQATGNVGNLSLRAGYLADVQTSASVDVVTNATPQTEPEDIGELPAYDETRSEFSGGVSYRLGLQTFDAGYIFSNEKDHQSHTISLGYARDFFQRNSTLAVGYALGLNEIWRSEDAFFPAREKTTHGLNASWTQVLDAKTLAAVSYALAMESGYLASPYRFVMTSDGSFRTRELHPGARGRHALAFRLKRYLFRDTALEGSYRVYLDGWGVSSHTFGAAYLMQMTRWLQVEVHDRFYVQSDADFYRPSYAEPERLMSGDKELSALWNNMVGARVGVALGPFGSLGRLRLDGKFDYLHFRYDNFPLRPRLNAYVGQVGLGLEL